MLSNSTIEKRTRKRKRQKRLSFDAKIAFITEMMNKNSDALTLIRKVSGWGFTMSQIADMTTYERSTALMNDLLAAVDRKMLALDVRPNPSSGLSPVTYVFFTHDEYRYALKQGRLFS